MTIFIQALAFGIVSASVIAIASVGFTMQFGVTNVLNLAYGDVMTVCAFVAYYVYSTSNSLPLAFLAGAVTGAGLSWLLSRYVYRIFVRHGTSLVGMIIVTLLVAVIMQNVLLAFVGSAFRVLSVPAGRQFGFGAFKFTSPQLFVVVLAVVLMLLVQALLHRTRLGRAMRATASNSVLAQASGVKTDRVVDTAWLMSGLLCGLAGVVLVMSTTAFETTTGSAFLIVVVAAAMLGGVGNPTGAMIGALIVGLVSSITASYTNASYQYVFAFGVLIVVLLVRPWGIFGQPGGVREVTG
jgi:branched-subunit amino acid ABC-type transport system permease component